MDMLEKFRKKIKAIFQIASPDNNISDTLKIDSIRSILREEVDSAEKIEMLTDAYTWWHREIPKYPTTRANEECRLCKKTPLIILKTDGLRQEVFCEHCGEFYWREIPEPSLNQEEIRTQCFGKRIRTDTTLPGGTKVSDIDGPHGQ